MTYDHITESGLFALRLPRRLKKDAEAGNDYARRVLIEEGYRHPEEL
jgi:hypothetical protein